MILERGLYYEGNFSGGKVREFQGKNEVSQQYQFFSQVNDFSFSFIFQVLEMLLDFQYCISNILNNYRKSFPHENHCQCCKKLASRSWLVLFTLTFFYIHSPLLQQNKNLSWLLFSSANQITYHCSAIYITRLF